MYNIRIIKLNKKHSSINKTPKKEKRYFLFHCWVCDSKYGRHFECVFRMDFWYALLPQCHKSSLNSRILPPIKDEGVCDYNQTKRRKFLRYKLCHLALSTIMNSVFAMQSFPKILSLLSFGIDKIPCKRLGTHFIWVTFIFFFWLCKGFFPYAISDPFDLS